MALIAASIVRPTATEATIITLCNDNIALRIVDHSVIVGDVEGPCVT